MSRTPHTPRTLVLWTMIASLSAIVGCGARSGPANVPTAPTHDEARDETSWTPPEEVAMSFASARESNEKEAAKMLSIRPNRGPDRPTHGAVHAAR